MTAQTTDAADLIDELADALAAIAQYVRDAHTAFAQYLAADEEEENDDIDDLT